jgi:hypothetical protein
MGTDRHGWPEKSDERAISPTRTPLEEYQAFIDGLLGWPRHAVIARWVREWGTPGPKTYQTPEAFNQRMRLFTAEQRQVLADMLQEEHEAGIHAVLAYLTDKVNLEGLRLSRYGVELAIEPYGTEMFWDWREM